MDLLSALRPEADWLAEGVLHLPNAVAGIQLDPLIAQIAELSPFRHYETPGGKRMSVAMTSCGAAGWISDRRGYRYSRTDPITGAPWPEMPQPFFELANGLARRFGAHDFAPDSCLINRYTPGAKLSLHQDLDEEDLSHPVVSISLGATARFEIGGATRASRRLAVDLEDGDALVFGGPARRAFHGVKPLAANDDQRFGGDRINLTFRRASAITRD